MSSRASWAEYRSSATTKATSWPWKRTLSVARTAWVSPAMVGIQARPCSSRSFPVMTADLRVLESRGDVYAVYLGVGEGAAQDRRVKHPRQLQIVHVLALAADKDRKSVV